MGMEVMAHEELESAYICWGLDVVASIESYTRATLDQVIGNGASIRSIYPYILFAICTLAQHRCLLHLFET